MSRTNLKPEQEIVIREFLDACVALDIQLDVAVIGGLLTQMGYRVLAPGKIVSRDKEIKTIYGDPDPYRNIEDEYGPDYEALREELGLVDTLTAEEVVEEVIEEAIENSGTDETDSSESPESDEVGDVLQ